MHWPMNDDAPGERRTADRSVDSGAARKACPLARISLGVCPISFTSMKVFVYLCTEFSDTQLLTRGSRGGVHDESF